MTRFDAIIIGAGQAGPPLAGRLTAAGMSVAFVERDLFGGTCVNTGCMPTKTLVASARAAHVVRRGAEYGVSVAGAIEIDMARVKARADAVAANARMGVEKGLRGLANGTVIDGHARFEGPDRVRVGERTLSAPRIFVNVGGRASVPDLPGIRDVSFLTNSSMLALDRVPEHLVVVGGSYVGLEFGQMYRRFGAQVTIVEKSPRLVAREDEDVSEAIRGILEGEGVSRPHRRGVHPSRAARERGRRRGRLCGRRARRHRVARPARGGAASEHGRPRPRTRRSRHGRARLHRRGRRARHQRPRHLGARRLQRPRRLHAHLVQRLRDRRRQPARRRKAPGERPRARVRALHRSAPRPRRDDRARGACERPTAA